MSTEWNRKVDRAMNDVAKCVQDYTDNHLVRPVSVARMIGVFADALKDYDTDPEHDQSDCPECQGEGTGGIVLRSPEVFDDHGRAWFREGDSWGVYDSPDGRTWDRTGDQRWITRTEAFQPGAIVWFDCLDFEFKGPIAEVELHPFHYVAFFDAIRHQDGRRVSMPFDRLNLVKPAPEKDA